MVDDATTKTLELLHGSPRFVFRQGDVAFELVRPDLIPADGHTYWVAGESVLPDGTHVSSVFVLEDGGGKVAKVYWRMDDRWQEPNESQFDRIYAVPVTNDDPAR